MTRSVSWPYKKEFACHRCGNCCRGDGYVEMTDEDVMRAADALAMDAADFVWEFCRPGGDGHILKDQRDEEQSCIFLTDDNGLSGCRIHAAKPAQCAQFPFGWRPRNITSFCAGMREVVGLPPPERSTMSGVPKRPESG